MPVISGLIPRDEKRYDASERPRGGDASGKVSRPAGRGDIGARAEGKPDPRRYLLDAAAKNDASASASEALTAEAGGDDAEDDEKSDEETAEDDGAVASE